MYAADSNMSGRFELHARRELVGMGLFQIGIDAGDGATKAEKLRALLAGLEHAVTVQVDPCVASPTEIVLVGR